jgi:hypothetical protein
MDAVANTLGVVLGAVLGVLAGRLRVFRRE